MVYTELISTAVVINYKTLRNVDKFLYKNSGLPHTEGTWANSDLINIFWKTKKFFMEIK